MAQTGSMKRQFRIAVVGGGISGIGCLWGLRHEDFDVHLYEADSRLGGHANTVMFDSCGHSVPVDTGFIAMNEKTYPEFTAFLRSLDVETIPTDMSFSVSEDDGAFAWGSTSIWAFVGSVFNIFRPWFWRLIFDIIRFNYFASDILSQFPDSADGDHDSYRNECDSNGKHYPDGELESIGTYLDRQGYSDHFKKYFIIPMVAAPWCIDPEEFSQSFPAVTLIQFMVKQGLLDTVCKRLHWRTVKYGSKAYIDAFLESIPQSHHIHLETPIKTCVRHHDGQVCLTMADGSIEKFDHVVFAVHANQALNILGEGVTPTEYEILRHFRTTENVCILHSDMSLMPRQPNARASWNCLIQRPETRYTASKEEEQKTETRYEDNQSSRTGLYPRKISVTFDMNRLQAIPLPGEPGSPGRVLVSMNPFRSPRAAKGMYKYSHPLYSSGSILASRSLHIINGATNVSFAGAWMGYGFHEDGFAAGLHVAEKILRRTEHRIRNLPTGTKCVKQAPRWRLRDRFCRAMIQIVHYFV